MGLGLRLLLVRLTANTWERAPLNLSWLLRAAAPQRPAAATEYQYCGRPSLSRSFSGVLLSIMRKAQWMETAASTEYQYCGRPSLSRSFSGVLLSMMRKAQWMETNFVQCTATWHSAREDNSAGRKAKREIRLKK